MSKILIVVPCYNEEKRLPAEVLRAFVQSTDGIDFLLVNDGSSDGTQALIESLAAELPGRLAAHSLPSNQGKAEAVRQGMRLAIKRGATITGFWDADLATPLDEILGFLTIMESRPGVEVVIGARIKLLGREVQRRLLRHYIGRVFATAASNYLRLPVYDTQCGAKLFRNTGAFRRAMTKRFLARWLFDVELFVRLLREWRREGDSDPPESRMVEVPLQTWTDVKGSKVKPEDFPKAIGEFARIIAHYGWKP